MNQKLNRNRISLAADNAQPAAHETTNQTLSPLLLKLRRIARLSEDDVAEIRAWPHRTAVVRGGGYLVREGELVDQCCVLLDGHAFRSKLTGYGARQILAFHLVGDLVDLQHVELARADHNIQALDELVVAWVPVDAIKRSMTARPAIARALWRDSMIGASIFREWILNVGRRDARSRIAHLLCEFIYRRELAMAGKQQRRLDLPMSQEQIADATGLTPVHVNRMLHHLQAERLIQRDRRSYHINDWDALCRVADFDPAYLNLS